MELAMMVSPQDASAALRDIDDAQARSAMLLGYQRAAPHFLIWGIIWAVGYGLTDFTPWHGNAVWGALVPIGLFAGYLSSRGGRHNEWPCATARLRSPYSSTSPRPSSSWPR